MSLSCFDPMFGERMLSVAEALEVLGESLSALPRKGASECIPLGDALGRVLAETVVSPLNVPAQTNAAMDGIALAHASLRVTATDDIAELTVIGSSLAGHPWTGRALKSGEALRITTGAALPAGADSVVMQEQLEYIAGCGQGGDDSLSGAALSNTGLSNIGHDREARVVIAGVSSVRHGQNVRQAGEDIPRDSQVMTRGQRLTPAAIGVLASLGLAEVEVQYPLTVAVFSTGDEVTAPGDTLPDGGVFDANRFSLGALLKAQGIEVLDLGILPDEQSVLESALRDAAGRADMVVTSGGVSVGEADHVRDALQRCGELAVWRIAMRPGRPLAFGLLNSDENRQVPFFGLPGNPVASMVTFLQFVLPALRQMAGQQALTDTVAHTSSEQAVASSPASACLSTSLARWQSPRLQMIAGEAMHSRAERVDYHRGRIVLDDEGRQLVMTTGRQGSGILTSMLAAECLIEIPAGRDGIAMGDPVMVQWLGN